MVEVTNHPFTASKKAVTTHSIIASGSLAILKCVVGLLTGSLGILAESAHSFLDLGSSVITFLVIRISASPPDRNHPYGHQRAEHLGALAGMTLLAGTAFLILYHAFDSLFFHPRSPAISFWSFGVLLLGILVDFFRARELRRAAVTYHSDALASDAEHFANDLAGALAVLTGLAVVAFAQIWPIPFWLVSRADSIAALIVAVIAMRSVWSVGSRAVRSLMDDVPPDISDRLRKRVGSLDGVVKGTVNLRTRYIGSRPHVEVRLGTPRGSSLESAHELSESVERAISEELGDAEAIVHIEPTATPDEPCSAAVYSVADRLRVRVHNLNIYLVGQEQRIELDLEMADNLTLAEAHAQSEVLEKAIVREIANPGRVTVHLEPRSDRPRPAVRHAASTKQVRELLARLPEAAEVEVEDILVTDAGLVVTLGKQFAGDTPLAEAHEVMSRLERVVISAFPDVVRVHIDPEIRSTGRK